MYDNNKKAHSMRITSSGITKGKSDVQIYETHNAECDGFTITLIKSACFVPYGDKIYILSQDSNLIQYIISSKLAVPHYFEKN